MSQIAVETVLGRLLTDTQFRRRFRRRPATTGAPEVFDLTAEELDALRALDQGQLASFTRRLDPKIVRAPMSRASRVSRRRMGRYPVGGGDAGE